MQENHSGSSSRWRRAADNGTLRRIAAPAKGACRLTADAFIHLPDTQARVTHPKKSLRLTPESCMRGSILARHPDASAKRV
jgi:hypothetical protein